MLGGHIQCISEEISFIELCLTFSAIIYIYWLDYGPDIFLRYTMYMMYTYHLLLKRQSSLILIFKSLSTSIYSNKVSLYLFIAKWNLVQGFTLCIYSYHAGLKRRNLGSETLKKTKGNLYHSSPGLIICRGAECQNLKANQIQQTPDKQIWTFIVGVLLLVNKSNIHCRSKSEVVESGVGVLWFDW